MNRNFKKSFQKLGSFKELQKTFKIYYVNNIPKNKYRKMIILLKNVLKWQQMNLNKKMRKEMNYKFWNSIQNLKKKNASQNKNITRSLIN